ncbi:MAG TPA: DUF2726 domain-containing protein [Pirellulales bacterium]|nr:DUF2726 domain-containing protein [Pirellulales bacterium]
MTNTPRGCLAAILGFFGIKLGHPSEASGELPYRQRDDFLSAAELSFHRVLVGAVGSRASVCPKVNLADIFFVVRPNENQHYRSRIDRKHVDFLLCDPATMTPRCAVELDDSSHARRDRQERDEFVDQVFKVAGLPLVRVPAQTAYSPASVLALIEPHLVAGMPSGLPPISQPTAAPICPKCGVPMLQRVAK